MIRFSDKFEPVIFIIRWRNYIRCWQIYRYWQVSWPFSKNFHQLLFWGWQEHCCWYHFHYHLKSSINCWYEDITYSTIGPATLRCVKSFKTNSSYDCKLSKIVCQIFNLVSWCGCKTQLLTFRSNFSKTFLCIYKNQQWKFSLAS